MSPSLLLLVVFSSLVGLSSCADHDLYCGVDSAADLSTIPAGDRFVVHSHADYGDGNYPKDQTCTVDIIKVGRD